MNSSVITTIGDNATDLVPFAHAHKPSYEESIRAIFYLLSPEESTFKDISNVPNYLDNAFYAFITLIVIEYIVCLLAGIDSYRINDGIGSISAGVVSRLILLISKQSLGLVLYLYVWNNWRVVELPWDSYWTWFGALIGVDFIYYWFHRAAHEVNFFWAAHQTHHSSEYYNLTTALRQSAFQGFTSICFGALNGLIIPPSVHLVHSQINTLFQFWIHTEIISTLGPLEYVLNTPSHHRVHHGRNPYCIDKNYAGVFIVWDRMFGTFEAERKDEKVAYGLVHPLASFNPIHVQLCHYWYILKTVWNTKGVVNKLFVLIKGPGWSPGKPRLGEFEDLPQVESPVQRYDPRISNILSVYALLHYFAIGPVYDQLMALRLQMPSFLIAVDVLLVLISLTSIGFVLDARKIAPTVEFIRCGVMAGLLYSYKQYVVDVHELPGFMGDFLQYFYLLSALAWVLFQLTGVTVVKKYDVKQD